MTKADSHDMARIPAIRKDIMETGKMYMWQPSKKQGGKRKKGRKNER